MQMSATASCAVATAAVQNSQQHDALTHIAGDTLHVQHLRIVMTQHTQMRQLMGHSCMTPANAKWQLMSQHGWITQQFIMTKQTHTL